MGFEEFKEVLRSDETKQIGTDIVENAIGALGADPIACKNLGQLIIKSPFSLRDQFFWNRFYNFLRGIYLDPGDAVILSDKLFGNDKNKRRNGMRLFEYIGKIDTEDTLQFMINATRSLLLSLITVTDYFRIVKAVTESLYEDLVFLSEHIIEDTEFTGNIQILALSRTGLMIEAGIDANSDVENQKYVFTTLGKMVDQYAISIDNEERYKWHDRSNKNTRMYDIGDIGMEAITTDEINKLF